MEKENVIKLEDLNGVEREVEVISYFTLNSNGKKYAIYTENKVDSAGNVEVDASEVIEHEDGSFEFIGIEDDNVWDEVKRVMLDLAKEGE